MVQVRREVTQRGLVIGGHPEACVLARRRSIGMLVLLKHEHPHVYVVLEQAHQFAHLKLSDDKPRAGGRR